MWNSVLVKEDYWIDIMLRHKYVNKLDAAVCKGISG